MGARTQNTLNRALEDLNDGMKVLLGFGEPGLNFIGALLRGNVAGEPESALRNKNLQDARHRSPRKRSRARLVRIK